MLSNVCKPLSDNILLPNLCASYVAIRRLKQDFEGMQSELDQPENFVAHEEEFWSYLVNQIIRL